MDSSWSTRFEFGTDDLLMLQSARSPGLPEACCDGKCSLVAVLGVCIGLLSTLLSPRPNWRGGGD